MVSLYTVLHSTKPSSENWDEMQEEATQLNNRVSLFNQAWGGGGGETIYCLGLHRLRKKTHQNQIFFFFYPTGAGIQGLATSEILDLALAALSLGTTTLL